MKAARGKKTCDIEGSNNSHHYGFLIRNYGCQKKENILLQVKNCQPEFYIQYECPSQMDGEEPF